MNPVAYCQNEKSKRGHDWQSNELANEWTRASYIKDVLVQCTYITYYTNIFYFIIIQNVEILFHIGTKNYMTSFTKSKSKLNCFVAASRLLLSQICLCSLWIEIMFAYAFFNTFSIIYVMEQIYKTTKHLNHWMSFNRIFDVIIFGYFLWND